MSTEYLKVMSLKVFPNDTGKVKWGNSKFEPWKDGAPGDIHFRAGQQYKVSVFDNGDGSLGITFSIMKKSDAYAGGSDSLAGDLKQGGLKKIASELQASRGGLDDDIPF